MSKVVKFERPMSDNQKKAELMMENLNRLIRVTRRKALEREIDRLGGDNYTVAVNRWRAGA